MPGPGSQPQLPTPKMQPVQSSHLAALGHDLPSQTMIAAFRDGSTYGYLAVPVGTYERILTGAIGKSVGKTFQALVPGKFKSVKVKAAPPKR